jgi:DNA-binding winged helix-turn-helix (wHTH) protein
MNASSKLEFDDIHFVVSHNGVSATFNPLSFKLLRVLSDANGEIVSVKTLLDTVWEKQNVSPETLKQRVFVLRKALNDAFVSGIVIQAVRGEGYRLIIEKITEADTSPLSTEPLFSGNVETKYFLRFRSTPLQLFFVFLIILIATLIGFREVSHSGNKVIANNRIALWSNVTPSDMTKNAKAAYARWNNMLSQSNDGKTLQLVKSNQQEEIPLSLQARKDRIALISFFETIEMGEQSLITLSIIEPATATILRSDTIQDGSESDVRELLESHKSGIKALVSSQKLYLNKQQRDFANDPIWVELRALANP